MFHPPSPEQIERHLDRHPPRPPSPWSAWGPLLVSGVVIVGSLFVAGPAAAVLPWLTLGGLLVYLAARVRRARTLERRASEVRESAMLARYPEALRQAWRLIPDTAARPTLYIRLVAVLGQCLERVKAYEAALAAYDRLLPHLPEAHPGTLQVRVHYALAALGAERLADADDALRGLRGAIGPYAHTPVGAAYRLAELLQLVRTHHYADALDRDDRMLEDLRPLGVEAGYGHALLALCYRLARGGTQSPGDRRAAAALWWRRAKTLVAEQRLIDRFPELEVLREPAS